MRFFGCPILAWLTIAGAASVLANEPTYSPNVAADYPDQLLWGDTHVHTSYSTGDSYVAGNNTVTPEIAYRFARGETVTAWNGMRARIREPLDFLVIADHAEGLGLAYEMRDGNEKLLETPTGQAMRAAWEVFDLDPTSREALLDFRRATRGPLPTGIIQTIWERVIERAEAFNDPGTFTTLIGYEWTSSGAAAGRRGNLHRVVIFGDGAEKTRQIVPFSAADSPNPEDLWAFLQRYRESVGGQAISIPHNSNLSNGEMFSRTTFDGSDPTPEWLSLRQTIEPLVEITQQKGDSEAHPVLSPTDEFADFENWNSWAGVVADASAHSCCPDRRDPDFDADARREMMRGEYVREALKTGLDFAAEFGVNPFQLGFAGGTDTHTSLASADNDNFWAQYPNTPPTATRPIDRFVPGWETPLQWETAAGGYMAVWARENTRDAIFSAMQRREVYATTGPRIAVRFFGGWSFKPEDAFAPNVARIGYQNGSPMGQTLDGKGDAPTFLIAALRDPEGANLDRVQIIKGWRDADGELHEQVFNVAVSGARTLENAGSVGSTVRIEDASYDNSIGAPTLSAFWRDPDFDPREHAFYYARVIEIPTPRWPAYDAKYFGSTLPDSVPMVTRERAYTSPIWYSPN